jgi:beta-lactamase class D
MNKVAVMIFVLLGGVNLAMGASADHCGDQCTFVLLNGKTEEYQVVNPERAELRLSPFSTFKIPNSLIALDLGVVKKLDQKLSFDKEKYPVQQWWRKKWYEAPLNLKDSFKYSAVPIYQQIAFNINAERMAGYVDRFNYGNKDIRSGIDTFWLSGSLKISAREQVKFLRRLYKNDLNVSDKALSDLKTIMLVEQSADYKMYAKTGGGHIENNLALGWYVGFVETKTGVYYFALNLSGKTFSEIKNKRLTIVKSYLKNAGVL